METALHVENLAKNYKRSVRQPGLLGAFKGMFSSKTEQLHAVKGISFSIKRSERVGLIGENGAGKSTTLKMLTGILVPTSGELSVLGLTPWKERRQLALNIGVVFGQRPQLLWDIPVQETFRLLKAMYHIPDDVYKVTYNEAVRRLGLEALLKTPVRLLSLGQRMRCDLAAALLHAPAVAFLDEPTIGLDLTVKEQVREYIRDMQKQFGTTLLITTHDLKDITEVCDRLLLLDKGKLLFDGSLKAFEKRFANESRIVADLHQPATPASIKKLSAEIKRYGGKVALSEGRRLVLEYRKEGAAPALTQILLKRQKVADLALEKTDIETIVTKIYRKPLADKMKS
ncbi:MAG TPA: ATP-binding cassette domain-containing protein [bacterium]|jgi:ABC-2 type transport system ATP-binding protein|nr:ATP-binding cassette domain-containing protein [bacterium]